jgi:hypothetical protein
MALRVIRVLGFFLAVCAAVAMPCVLAGVLFAYFHGGPAYSSAIGWAMWIGGGLLVVLVGQSGSPARMAGESRAVVGGRFALGSDIPQPQSPFVLIPAGILVVALGVLIDVSG